MTEVVTLKINNNHLIKIVKNPKDANGYKYIGLYKKRIKMEDKKHGRSRKAKN